jgi:hypothetical protein
VSSKKSGTTAARLILGAFSNPQLSLLRSQYKILTKCGETLSWLEDGSWLPEERSRLLHDTAQGVKMEGIELSLGGFGGALQFS